MCVFLSHGSHFCARFTVVCVCDDTIPVAELIRMNTFCRNFEKNKESSPIVFLLGFIQGVTATLFSDFGPEHAVFDADGEPPKTLIIDGILTQKNGSVTVDGDRHLLSDGDHVRFEEVCAFLV